jgi:hypothetical protein
MQILSKCAKGSAEIECCVCRQGFVVIWERRSRAERSADIGVIQAALRAHHSKIAGPAAHPTDGFAVPESDSPKSFSGAAILGNAPTWAL